ncbi:MAG: hypothetical protein ACUZ8E_03740 [Candidatus Anammoxibacter sp.]
MKKSLVFAFIMFFVVSLSLVDGVYSQGEVEFLAPEFDQTTGLMKDIPALKGDDPTALIPNTDPGGIDDGTALDADGKAIEFNLHVPPDFTIEKPLADLGLENNSPEDDLKDLLDQMTVQEMDLDEREILVQQAIDILLGTNESGKLNTKAYLNFPLLNITSGNEEKIKRVNEWNNVETFDEKGNVDVKLIYYGQDIDADTFLLEIPPAFMDEPFTIKFTINNMKQLRCFAPTIMCQLPNPNFPAADDAEPFGKFSNGPKTIPYGAYDASFYEMDRLVRLDENGEPLLDNNGEPRIALGQGTQVEIVLAMPPAKFIKGIYTWGWRKHPPLTQFILLVPEGDKMPNGMLTLDAFANGQAKSVDDISDQAPEKIILKALEKFNKEQIDRPRFFKRFFFKFQLAIIEDVKLQIAVMKDKLTLPPGFEIDGNSDFTAVYMNGETYAESQQKKAGVPVIPPQKEGDFIKGTIINADNITSYYRTVMFSQGQFQFGTPPAGGGVHNEFGIFNWKPFYGVPMFVAGGWKSAFAAVSQNNLYTNDDQDGDLQHDFTDFSGFSGPAVFSENPPGSDGLFDFGFGVPIAPGETLFATMELPRNLGGARSVGYMFDPMRHDNTVFSMHLPE